MEPIQVVLSLVLILFDFDTEAGWYEVPEPEITARLRDTGLRKVTVLKPKDPTSTEPLVVIFGPIIPENWAIMSDEWMYRHKMLRERVESRFSDYRPDGGTFAKWMKDSNFLTEENEWLEGLLFFHASDDYGPAPLLMLRPAQQALEESIEAMVRWDRESLKQHGCRRSPYRDY